MPRLKSRWTQAIVTLALAGVFVACELAFPTHDLPPAVPIDEGIDDAASGTDAGCHAIPPQNPRHDTNPNDIPPIINAFQTVSYGGDDAGTTSPLGLDLDLTCTCGGQGSSCVARAKDAPLCDIDGGRDLAVNALLSSLLGDHGKKAFDRLFNERIVEGRFSLIVYLSQYNGGDDDSAVAVGIMLSRGVFDGFNADGGLTFRSPRWDGSDPWVIDLATANPVPGSNKYDYLPTLQSSAAWVNHGQLVAKLAQIDLDTFTLSDATLTATIKGDVDGGFRLDDGQLAGRISVRSFLLFVGSQGPLVPDAGHQFFCEDTEAFVPLRKQICTKLDIALNPDDDGKGKPCDALSWALAFKALPGVFGPPTRVPRAVGCNGDAGDCSD